MGVRKLNKFLIDKRLINEYQTLEEYINIIRSDPSRNNRFDNKIVIAIDFWLYMHKFLHSSRSTNIVIAFFNQIIRFLNLGIIPIYIADGYVPVEKEEEHNDRILNREKQINKIHELDLEIQGFNDKYQNISEDDGFTSDLDLIHKRDVLLKNVKRATKDEIDEIIKVFDIMNISFVRAQYEADALCTLLYREKMITACLSDDMDMLALGCGSTIRIEKGKIIEYDLKYILESLELNQEQFIDLCIIFGCGYLKHTIRVDTESAYIMIRESGNLLDALFSGIYPDFNIEIKNINVIGEGYHNVSDIYLDAPNNENINFTIEIPHLDISSIINHLRNVNWFHASAKNINYLRSDLMKAIRFLNHDYN